MKTGKKFNVLDDISRNELIAMYSDGATFFELMKMFNIPMAEVQRIIKESIINSTSV
jgi:hypothetical protein